jgi:hypothetical protein
MGKNVTITSGERACDIIIECIRLAVYTVMYSLNSYRLTGHGFGPYAERDTIKRSHSNNIFKIINWLIPTTAE